MVRWTLQQIADATGGRVHGGSGETVVDGITQDSRRAGPGMLFVPLVAQRDGHDYISHALSRGAAAYLTAHSPATDSAAAVQVNDTAEALWDLARESRRRLGRLSGAGIKGSVGMTTPLRLSSSASDVVDIKGPFGRTTSRDLLHSGVNGVRVVGITGSVGKTTTKDLLAAVLGRERSVWASERSFNNEIGVPVTLISAPEHTEVLVVEMGARGRGHITRLCELAQPDMGVVTTVGEAHTSEFGSVEAVVKAKRELVEALPSAAEGGVAFLNAGVPEVAAMASSTRAEVVTFGAGGDFSARDVTLDDDLTPRFTLCSPQGEVPVVLGAKGVHLVDNALAVAAVALHIGVTLSDVATGLATPHLSPLRMELRQATNGARLLNDCYNANPISMRAALQALATLPARRRLAVLGTMAELGDLSEQAHTEVGALAADLGIGIVAVDAPAYSMGGGVIAEVSNIAGALDTLHGLGWPRADDALLVKASRSVGLEQLVDRLECWPVAAQP